MKDEMRDTYVMAIDVRRSTELMLKSRNPESYSTFIVDLIESFRNVVVSNKGIFYQFTGDGALCLFPEFHSGEEAGMLVLKIAKECHSKFNSVYKDHRNCFQTVLVNVGLGIGIDYGKVYMTKIGNDMTIVGTPVVYASRMSAANAGDTLLNQTAMEAVRASQQNYKMEEYIIDVKHEGGTLAYRIA